MVGIHKQVRMRATLRPQNWAKEFPAMSGSVFTRENVGPKILARDLPASRKLDPRPPLGVEQHLVVDPIRDVLLAGSSEPVLPHASGQGGLGASGDLDGPVEGGNVGFIHRHPKYTNAFVRVNNSVCVTAHKEACTVLDMATSRSKHVTQLRPHKEPSSKRVAKPGPDGQTLGQRVAVAMGFAAGRRGGEYTEADLLSDVNRMAGAPPDSPLLSQQALNAIRQNKVSRSAFSHLIAKACGVSPDWLAFGIGKMTG
jgi:hypothetical protein